LKLMTALSGKSFMWQNLLKKPPVKFSIRL
jgi:hypothetical protein